MNFYDLVKFCVAVLENIDAFTTYQTLFQYFIKVVLIIYHNKSKTKMLGKNRKCLVWLQEVASYINYLYYTSYLCIMFGRFV